MAPRWLKWNLYGSSFKYENKFGPINDCFEEYVRKYDCFKSYEKNFLWCGVIWTLKEFSIFFMIILKGKRIQEFSIFFMIILKGKRIQEFSIFFMIILKGKRIQEIWMIGSDLVL